MLLNSARGLAYRSARFPALDAGQAGMDPIIFRIAGGSPGPQAAAPQGSNGTVTATEDILYVFSQTDFGYSDSDGHAFAGIVLTTTPTRGSMVVNGSSIGAGSFISAATIAAGGLSFEAGLDASGNNFATFTFQVRDSSGAQDNSPNTITVNVLPVNDPPIYRNFNSGSAMTFNEGQTTTLRLDTMGNGTVQDIDSADFSGGYLRVTAVQGGVPAEDRFGIDNTSAVTISGTAVGSSVSVDGIVIGVIAAGGTGINEDLIVSFNAAATPVRVQSLIRALNYFNVAENPTGQSRLVKISLNDGDGPEIGSTSLTLGIQGFNDAPVLSEPTTTHLNYTPGSPLIPLWEGVTMTDPDNQPNFVMGAINMSGGGSSAVVELLGTRFTRNNADFLVDNSTGLTVGSIFMFRGTVQITGLSSTVTAEVVNALIHSFGFRTENANATPGDFEFNLTFFDGSYMFGGGITSNMVHQTITVSNPSPVPIIDLNGPGGDVNAVVHYTENGSPIGLIQGSAQLFGANGSTQIDKLTLSMFGAEDTDVLTWGTLPAGVTVSVQEINFRRVITFSGAAATTVYRDLLASIRYSTTDDTPISMRSVEIVVESGGVSSATARTDIYITETDDFGVARNDIFVAPSNDPMFGNVGFDNGYGSDADPDGFNVIAVNGSAGNVGQVMTLASGARLSVQSGGGVTFEANNGYPAGGFETFTYTIAGGTSATATILIGAINRVTGTAGIDDLAGSANSDVLLGQDGNDALRGNGGADFLDGGAGEDLLDGGAGADRMVGGLGDDNYYVDQAGDVVVELAGEGFDAVYTSADYTLTTGASVEWLSVISTSATTALNITGNEFGQYLLGNAGANILDGGGGADVMIGYGGDDTYLIDNAVDAVIEAVGGGNDTIRTSASYYLSAGVEVETLAAANAASLSGLFLTGNEFAQSLFGTDGFDVLNGAGGADLMTGYGGSDTYYVDNAGDQVAEAAGKGFDAVYSAVSYTLGAGAEVEWFSTIDNAATNALNLTGNAFNQYLVGNAGANVLDGGGGIDLMYGLGGDDIYIIDNAGDVPVENANGGFDTVRTSVSYLLSAGISVEKLETGNAAGTDGLYLIGNELGQELIGNAGANSLNGAGGADVMRGLGGNDIYYVDVSADQVIEAAGQGFDTIYTEASFALAAGSEVEWLSAATVASTAAIDLTGNEFVNYVLGNNGANVINGGAGSDIMTGYGGADTFAFTTTLGANNIDLITDFVSGTDRIALDDAIFAGLAPGGLAATAFVVGGAALDADDRIVYNSATGQLFYDADGNGAGAAILFATLQGNPALAASDFVVI